MLGLSKLDKVKYLWVVISKMLVEGCCLDLDAYCVLVQGMSVQNRMKECLLLFNMMVDNGIRDKGGGSKLRYMVTPNIHFSCMNASGDFSECSQDGIFGVVLLVAYFTCIVVDGEFYRSNIKLNRAGRKKSPNVKEDYRVHRFYWQKKLTIGSNVHGSFGLQSLSITRNRLLLIFVIVGSVRPIAGIYTIVFCLWTGLCGFWLNCHDSVQTESSTDPNVGSVAARIANVPNALLSPSSMKGSLSGSMKGNLSGPMGVVEYAKQQIMAGELQSMLDPRVGKPDPKEGEAVELVAYTAMRCMNLDGGKDIYITTFMFGLLTGGRLMTMREVIVFFTILAKMMLSRRCWM